MNDKEYIAYHECGHAVLAFLTGAYVIQEINITEEVHAATHIEIEDCLHKARLMDCQQIDLAYERAIISAAGMQAEKMRYIENGVSYDERALFQGAHGDVLEVRELLGKGKWCEVLDRAKQYLENPQYWNMVTTLVSKLIKCNGKLKAGTIDDVLVAKRVEFNIPVYIVLK
jgi:hypothetical protein